MREALFVVLMAGYVLDFHQHNRCSKCLDDWCPRVAMARARIIVWRQRRKG